MLRKPLVSLLAAALLALGGGAVVATSAPAAASPVRIMPLGDSITAGPGCWRAYLWNKLQTAGYPNIDFVGTQSDGGSCNPGFSYDADHEGHGGYSITGIANANQLPPWLASANPDVIMVHLGTNDMWGGWIPLADKLTAYTKLIGQMRAQNPNVKIIVAQIIPMSTQACATCPADVKAFDEALPSWAAGLSTSQSPITIADLWSGYDAVADNTDGTHPNTGGFKKMADSWFPAVAAVLSGQGGGSTTTTTRPTTTSTRPTTTTTRPTTTTTRPTTTTTRPTTTTTTTRSTTTTTSTTTGGGGTGGCTAGYKVASQWGGGFQGDVTVTNSGTSASKSWTVTLTFADGQQLTQAWNATATQSGSTVTAVNAGYNGALSAGGSASFGFLANWGSTNSAPVVRCTLG
jgi:lysophospholipase L1-like esterase